MLLAEDFPRSVSVPAGDSCQRRRTEDRKDTDGASPRSLVYVRSDSGGATAHAVLQVRNQRAVNNCNCPCEQVCVGVHACMFVHT